MTDFKRYVTIEDYDGTLTAMTEQENYTDKINHHDTACWVWQFAESKEQAISQHYDKLERWENDPSRDTY